MARRKDEELDLEGLDVEDFDFDIDSLGEDDIDFDDRKPESKPGILRKSGAFTKAILRGITGKIENVISTRFPNVANVIGEIKSAPWEIRSGIAEHASDISEFAESYRVFRNKTVPVLANKYGLPKLGNIAKSILPGSDYEPEEEQESTSPKDELPEDIKGFLNAKLGRGSGTDRDRAGTISDTARRTKKVKALKETRAKEALNKLEQRFTEYTQHSDQMTAIHAVRDQLKIHTEIQTRFHVPYMKKQLELSYKSLVIQKSILDVQTNISETLKSRLDAIQKNTALPDLAKVNLTEVMGDVFKRNIFSSVQKSIGGLLGNLAGDITKHVGDIASIAGLPLTMSNMYGELYEDADFADFMDKKPISDLTDLLAYGTGRFVVPYFNNKFNLTHRVMERFNVKERASAIYEKLSDVLKEKTEGKIDLEEFRRLITDNYESLDLLAENTPQKLKLLLDNLRKGRMSQRIENPERAEKIEKLEEFLSDFLSDDNRRIYQDKGARVFDPAIFDIKTHTTINDVIPGYLSRILTAVTSIDTKVPDTSGVSAQPLSLAYDYTARQFVTDKELTTRTMERILGSSAYRSLLISQPLAQVSSNIKEDTSKPELAIKFPKIVEDLKVFITNALRHKYFPIINSKDIKEMYEQKSYSISNYSDDVLKGVKNPEELIDFLYTYMYDTEGRLNLKRYHELENLLIRNTEYSEYINKKIKAALTQEFAHDRSIILDAVTDPTKRREGRLEIDEDRLLDAYLKDVKISEKTALLTTDYLAGVSREKLKEMLKNNIITKKQYSDATKLKNTMFIRNKSKKELEEQEEKEKAKREKVKEHVAKLQQVITSITINENDTPYELFDKLSSLPDDVIATLDREVIKELGDTLELPTDDALSTKDLINHYKELLAKETSTLKQYKSKAKKVKSQIEATIATYGKEVKKSAKKKVAQKLTKPLEDIDEKAIEEMSDEEVLKRAKERVKEEVSSGVRKGKKVLLGEKIKRNEVLERIKFQISDVKFKKITHPKTLVTKILELPDNIIEALDYDTLVEFGISYYLPVDMSYSKKELLHSYLNYLNDEDSLKNIARTVKSVVDQVDVQVKDVADRAVETLKDLSDAEKTKSKVKKAVGSVRSRSKEVKDRLLGKFKEDKTTTTEGITTAPDISDIKEAVSDTTVITPASSEPSVGAPFKIPIASIYSRDSIQSRKKKRTEKEPVFTLKDRIQLSTTPMLPLGGSSARPVILNLEKLMKQKQSTIAPDTQDKQKPPILAPPQSTEMSSPGTDEYATKDPYSIHKFKTSLRGLADTAKEKITGLADNAKKFYSDFRDRYRKNTEGTVSQDISDTGTDSTDTTTSKSKISDVLKNRVKSVRDYFKNIKGTMSDKVEEQKYKSEAASSVIIDSILKDKNVSDVDKIKIQLLSEISTYNAKILDTIIHTQVPVYGMHTKGKGLLGRLKDTLFGDSEGTKKHTLLGSAFNVVKSIGSAAFTSAKELSYLLGRLLTGGAIKMAYKIPLGIFNLGLSTIGKVARFALDLGTKKGTFVDVYIFNPDTKKLELLVDADTLKKHGVYPDGKKVESSYNIKDTVYDNSTGNVIISKHHVEKGLYDKRGEPLVAKHILLRLLKFGWGTVTTLLGGYTKILGKLAHFTLKGFKRLIERKNPYIDVYAKDEVHPDKVLVYGEGIRRGEYVFLDGKKVTSAYEIDQPVYKLEPNGEIGNCVVTRDHLYKGLVDINNNPVNRFSGKSILGKIMSVTTAVAAAPVKLAYKAAKGLGKLALKGAKALFDKSKDALSSIKEGAGSFKDRISKKIDSLFVTNLLEPKHIEDLVTTRLDTIIKLLKKGFKIDVEDDKTGEGLRDNSYEEYKAKKEQEEQVGTPDSAGTPTSKAKSVMDNFKERVDRYKAKAAEGGILSSLIRLLPESFQGIAKGAVDFFTDPVGLITGYLTTKFAGGSVKNMVSGAWNSFKSMFGFGSKAAAPTASTGLSSKGAGFLRNMGGKILTSPVGRLVRNTKYGKLGLAITTALGASQLLPDESKATQQPDTNTTTPPVKVDDIRPIGVEATTKKSTIVKPKEYDQFLQYRANAYGLNKDTQEATIVSLENTVREIIASKVKLTDEQYLQLAYNYGLTPDEEHMDKQIIYAKNWFGFKVAPAVAVLDRVLQAFNVYPENLENLYLEDGVEKIVYISETFRKSLAEYAHEHITKDQFTMYQLNDASYKKWLSLVLEGYTPTTANAEKLVSSTPQKIEKVEEKSNISFLTKGTAGLGGLLGISAFKPARQATAGIIRTATKAGSGILKGALSKAPLLDVGIAAYDVYSKYKEGDTDEATRSAVKSIGGITLGTVLGGAAAGLSIVAGPWAAAAAYTVAYTAGEFIGEKIMSPVANLISNLIAGGEGAPITSGMTPNTWKFFKLRCDKYGISEYEEYVHQIMNLEKETEKALDHSGIYDNDRINDESMLRIANAFNIGKSAPRLERIKYVRLWFTQRFVPISTLYISALRSFEKPLNYDEALVLDKISVERLTSAFLKYYVDTNLEKYAAIKLNNTSFEAWFNKRMELESKSEDSLNAADVKKDLERDKKAGASISKSTELSAKDIVAAQTVDLGEEKGRPSTTTTTGTTITLTPTTTGPSTKDYTSGASGTGTEAVKATVGTAPSESGLGSLSAKHESRGNRMAIGYDLNGGTSYGKYQIASRPGSFAEFISWLLKTGKAPQFAKRIVDAVGSPPPQGAQSRDWGNTFSNAGKVPDAWIEGIRAGELPPEVEYEYIYKTHYEPALNRIRAKKPELANLIDSSNVLKEMLFSSTVQQRTADKIFLSQYRDGMSQEELITAIYKERANHFGSSTKKTQESVKKRLENEMNDALAMAKNEKSAAIQLPSGYTPKATGAEIGGLAGNIEGTAKDLRRPAGVVPSSTNTGVAAQSAVQPTSPAKPAINTATEQRIAELTAQANYPEIKTMAGPTTPTVKEPTVVTPAPVTPPKTPISTLENLATQQLEQLKIIANLLSNIDKSTSTVSTFTQELKPESLVEPLKVLIEQIKTTTESVAESTKLISTSTPSVPFNPSKRNVQFNEPYIDISSKKFRVS